MNIDDENNLIRIYGRILKILITSPNVCTFCKHYFMNVSKDKGIRLCCDAFPEGIPRGIFNSAYDHRVPFPKDKGIRFELKPNLSEEEVRHVEERAKEIAAVVDVHNSRRTYKDAQNDTKPHEEGDDDIDDYEAIFGEDHWNMRKGL